MVRPPVGVQGPTLSFARLRLGAIGSYALSALVRAYMGRWIAQDVPSPTGQSWSYVSAPWSYVLSARKTGKFDTTYPGTYAAFYLTFG